MAVSNYYKVQSNTSGKHTQLQNYKDIITNPIGMIPQQPEFKHNEYQAQQQSRWDQQRMRSVSSKQEEKIKYLYLQAEPNSINQYNIYNSNFEQKQQMVTNQDYNSNWINNFRNNNQYNPNKGFSQNSQKRPLGLEDQIDIALNQQKQNSQSKQKKIELDIEKRQKFDQGYFELFNNDIKNPSHMVQLQNSRPPSKQQEQKKEEEDSMNCTQVSFMQTKNSNCNYCQQDIYKNRVNLVCWHSYHIECLSEVVGSQIQLSHQQNVLTCSCGNKINHKTIFQLPNGKQLIKTLMQKQLNAIFRKHPNQFKKCPKCEFRFIQDIRLRKACYCDNCGWEFKIQ
ncbi:unnamed protein product [Paramecium octaurelia]|uniref:RING-type domain-containing protein n=1 Tax=Paramecium octaurelia TaxID=43137 RepID=A0A8S1X058_PAROT|nr:unnamed protein product [Paramecium octaurelia]